MRIKGGKRLLNIVILGPQGSGKGTQSNILIRELGLQYIEMGKVLRKKAEERSEIGGKIKNLINKGNLLSDKMITKIFKEEFKKLDPKKGVIIDGFPRTLSQAKFLDEILIKKKRANIKAVFINISDREAIRRLSLRKTCKECGKIYTDPEKDVCKECGGRLIIREDDKPETIKKRLFLYHQESKKIKNYYRDRGILIEINGEDEIKKVHYEILKALKSTLNV